VALAAGGVHCYRAHCSAPSFSVLLSVTAMRGTCTTPTLNPSCVCLLLLLLL
jgi:hypothetical protein